MNCKQNHWRKNERKKITRRTTSFIQFTKLSNSIKFCKMLENIKVNERYSFLLVYFSITFSFNFLLFHVMRKTKSVLFSSLQPLKTQAIFFRLCNVWAFHIYSNLIQSKSVARNIPQFQIVMHKLIARGNWNYGKIYGYK